MILHFYTLWYTHECTVWKILRIDIFNPYIALQKPTFEYLCWEIFRLWPFQFDYITWTWTELQSGNGKLNVLKFVFKMTIFWKEQDHYALPPKTLDCDQWIVLGWNANSSSSSYIQSVLRWWPPSTPFDQMGSWENMKASLIIRNQETNNIYNTLSRL